MVSRSQSIRWLLVAAGLVLAHPVFPQAQIKLENTPSVTEVAPGGTVTIQSVTRNISNAPLTGFFSNTVNFEGGVFVSVQAADWAAISCGPIASAAGVAQRCAATSVTLEPNATIVLTSQVRVSNTAAQGSTVTFRSTVTGFGGQIALGFVFIEVQGTPVGAPQLDLAVGNATPDSRFAFTITNVGSAPTEGPIDFELYPAEGLKLTHAPEVFFYFEPVGSGYRLRREGVLQPGQSFNMFLSLVFGAARGTASFTAVVLGGGSPPDEETVSDANPPRRVLFTLVESPEPTDGRVRE